MRAKNVLPCLPTPGSTPTFVTHFVAGTFYGILEGLASKKYFKKTESAMLLRHKLDRKKNIIWRFSFPVFVSYVSIERAPVFD